MTKKYSKRESWAIRTGRPKSEYKNSAEGKEVKSAKKYYKEKKEFKEKDYKLTKKKLEEDLALVFEAGGIEKNRAIEDYTRNTTRLKEDKTTDLEELNYYLATNRGRNKEDLDFALKKEARRYGLEQDKLSESLASRNLVFSGLGGIRGYEEGNLSAETEEVQEGLQTTTKRSFEDLARMETVKNLSIEKEYGRELENEGTSKDRNIQDVDFATKKASIAKEQGLASAKLNKKETLYDLEKSKQDSYASIISRYNPQYLQDEHKASFLS